VRRRGSFKPLMDILEDRTTPSSLTTDLPDYFPGQTAILTASDFAVGETVEFHVTSDVAGPGQDPWSVQDGSLADQDGEANGTIVTGWLVDPNGAYIGATLTATATGDQGSYATTTFTDAVAEPTDFTATADSSSQITLEWTNASGSPDETHVERKLTSDPDSAFVEIATVPFAGNNAVETYVDTGLDADTS
jgi:hypothetical protein